MKRVKLMKSVTRSFSWWANFAIPDDQTSCPPVDTEGQLNGKANLVIR